MNIRLVMSCLFLFVAFATPAYADNVETRPATGGPGALPSRGNGMALETSVGQQNSDIVWNLSVILALDLPAPSLGCIDPTMLRCLTRFRVGVRAPLNVTLSDGGTPNNTNPQQDESFSQTMGRYFQLRYLEYGYADEPIHILLGELSGVSIGHGTVVNEYYNVLDISDFQMGMQLNVNTPYAGGEFLMDNVIDPSVMGGRLYVRPLAMLTGVPVLTQLAIGASFVTDLNAPKALSTSMGRLQFNQYNTPLVSQTERATIMSTDIEFNWFNFPRLTMGSYADFNWTLSHGFGAHLGTRLKVDPVRKMAVNAKLEYRWLGNGYIPDYIGPLYEVERYHAIGWGASTPQPKLGLVYGNLGGPSHGVYTELSTTLFDVWTLSGAYADYEGDYNTSMWFRMALAPIDIYQMSVFYYKANIKDAESLFDSGNSMVAAEARLGIMWPVYLFGQYSQLWFNDALTTDAKVTTWRAGLGASFAF